MHSPIILVVACIGFSLFFAGFVAGAGDGADDDHSATQTDLQQGTIVAHLKVGLNVVNKIKPDAEPGADDPFELLFATVHAGGMTIALDHNGCPSLIKELLNHRLGGAPTSRLLAEISGQMSFMPYSELEKSKHPEAFNARKIAADTLVPIVHIESLQIHILPNEPYRHRAPVKSTTIGITKRSTGAGVDPGPEAQSP